jgi:hypothetical protein
VVKKLPATHHASLGRDELPIVPQNNRNSFSPFPSKTRFWCLTMQSTKGNGDGTENCPTTVRKLFGFINEQAVLVLHH